MTFSALADQLTAYPEDERGVVYQAYGFASGLSEPETLRNFLPVSLDIACELASLRMPLEFVSSALLYYPISAGILRVGDLGVRTKALKDRLHEALAALLHVGLVFDQFLPWRMQEDHQAQLLTARLSLALHHADSRNEGERLRHAGTLLGALLSTQMPEIPITKSVERVCLLERGAQFLPPTVLRMLAQEALDVHAVAMEALGMQRLRSRLDDRAFATLLPDQHAAALRDLAERKEERDVLIDCAIRELARRLERARIEADISGRAKHLYGLYLKSRRTGLPIQEINDSLAIRVIVGTVEDCYSVLDLVFGLWQCAEGVYETGRYRDWIATPKPNGYQSLHVTVHYPDVSCGLLEVQIRTHEMHEIAEYGVATHWLYKRPDPGALRRSVYGKYVAEMARLRRQLERH